MQFNLFMDVSEEQQELTSGGGQLYNLYENDYTNFELQNFNLTKTIASTPYGSAISKSLTNQFVYTSAQEYLNAYFR